MEEQRGITIHFQAAGPRARLENNPLASGDSLNPAVFDFVAFVHQILALHLRLVSQHWAPAQKMFSRTTAVFTQTSTEKKKADKTPHALTSHRPGGHSAGSREGTDEYEIPAAISKFAVITNGHHAINVKTTQTGTHNELGH